VPHLHARLLLAAALCCAGCKRGRTGPGGVPVYVAHRASGPIDIDGVLSEPAWDKAERAGPLLRSLDGKPASANTSARILWDDEALYVAFQSEDPNLATPFYRDDEPLYTSNAVEIFLNPSGDLARYDEIELAPSNALFDASFTGRRQGMDLGWSSRARHAVHLDGTLNDPSDVDRGWTAELAIPFAALTGMPRPRPARGDEWRFNLYRLRQGPGQPGEGQAYSPPMVGDFHAVDRFAVLRFED
jgi:hypothetical protein